METGERDRAQIAVAGPGVSAGLKVVTGEVVSRSQRSLFGAARRESLGSLASSVQLLSSIQAPSWHSCPAGQCRLAPQLFYALRLRGRSLLRCLNGSLKSRQLRLQSRYLIVKSQSACFLL